MNSTLPMPAAALVTVQALHKEVKTDKPKIARLGAELARMRKQ